MRFNTPVLLATVMVAVLASVTTATPTSMEGDLMERSFDLQEQQEGLIQFDKRWSNLSNGKRCSKSKQCRSQNCSRARCRTKKQNGHSCYKDANCFSHRCYKKKCRAKKATTATNTGNHSVSTVTITTNGSTQTITQTATGTQAATGSTNSPGLIQKGSSALVNSDGVVPIVAGAVQTSAANGDVKGAVGTVVGSIVGSNDAGKITNSGNGNPVTDVVQKVTGGSSLPI